jgi:hypothetical protein
VAELVDATDLKANKINIKPIKTLANTTISCDIEASDLLAHR